MKIKSILLLAVIAIFTSACNKDDKMTVKDIVGTYEGYTLASCAYFQDRCTEGETIVITENSDGSARISYSSESWGDFIITNAQMTEENGTCMFTSNGKVEMGMGENISSYDFTFSATINTIDDASMKFSVAAVMGGLTIDFKTGSAATE